MDAIGQQTLGLRQGTQDALDSVLSKKRKAEDPSNDSSSDDDPDAPTTAVPQAKRPKPAAWSAGLDLEDSDSD